MKEKINREIRIVVQPSLYNAFQIECEKEMKTVSAVIRELMLTYVRQQNANLQNNKQS